MTKLTLDGLTALPAQVWGGVRLVPLVRDQPISGLRLHRQAYETEPAVVALEARKYYVSYIPHGSWRRGVMRWRRPTARS